MSLTEILQLIISGLTLGGIFFAVYKGFADPDIKARGRLDVLEASCKLKHIDIDKDLKKITNNITIIKENHLSHIERDMAEIRGDIKAISAVLKIRDK